MGFVGIVGIGVFFFLGIDLFQVFLELQVIFTRVIVTEFIVLLIVEVTVISETVVILIEVVEMEQSVFSLFIIGGVDKIAFVCNNDIWVMNVDGSDLKQYINDGLLKFNLQWLSDGKNIFYMIGKMVKTVNIETEVEEVVMNFVSAEYFEGFSVSLDGKQIVISVNCELFIVLFNFEKLVVECSFSRLKGMMNSSWFMLMVVCFPSGETLKFLKYFAETKFMMTFFTLVSMFIVLIVLLVM